MEALRELIYLITKKRIKKAELFDEGSRNKTSNYYRLFDGIHSQKYTSDETAAKDIYDCLPSEKKYLILKTRLKQKLLNTLFFLDYEGDDGSSYQQAVYECNKQLYAVKVLLMNNASRLAIPLAEKTLRMAEEFELTDIVAECAKIMREHCSATGQYQEFQEYKQVAERAESLLQAENLAERYLQELVATYAKANRLGIEKLAEEFHRLLGEMLQARSSTKLKWLNFRIKTMFHQFSDDYRSAIETITQAEVLLDQTPNFRLPARTEEIALQKMNYYLHLKDFEAGEAHAIQTMDLLFADDNASKAIIQEYRFLLAMHTGKYVEAATIFRNFVETPNFMRLSAAKRERWCVFQAYLHYLYKYMKIKEIRPLIQNSKTGFQLFDFLGNKPEFTKEKRGLNIAILTVQILFLLEKMNAATLAEHIGEIEKYSRRYPKKDIHFRSECFIGLLAKMRDENFRFYQTRKSLEKMFDEMCAVPMVYHGGNRALEVLPYETLWNMVLEKLKNHKYG